MHISAYIRIEVMHCRFYFTFSVFILYVDLHTRVTLNHIKHGFVFNYCLCIGTFVYFESGFSIQFGFTVK